jgi:hypothetical protein
MYPSVTFTDSILFTQAPIYATCRNRFGNVIAVKMHTDIKEPDFNEANGPEAVAEVTELERAATTVARRDEARRS